MLMMGEEREKLTKTAEKNREAYAKELKKGGRMKYFKDKYGMPRMLSMQLQQTWLLINWVNQQSLKRLALKEEEVPMKLPTKVI